MENKPEFNPALIGMGDWIEQTHEENLEVEQWQLDIDAMSLVQMVSIWRLESANSLRALLPTSRELDYFTTKMNELQRLDPVEWDRVNTLIVWGTE